MTDEKKVRVRILPLKGISGIGNAGDEVVMSADDANYWVEEGYVEILSDEAKAEVVEPAQPVDVEAPAEDHVIMKPRSKRLK